MLKTLDLEGCFTHQKLHVDFQHGLTAITGLNGKGKSLILEMVQYALWGSVALRGKAEDYKGQFVGLTFEVKGETYSVRRTSSTARLSKGEEPIAAGTKAVNAAIRALFGYGYEVFTMANAVNQDKILELGEMLPTARKKLVDQTIGLDRLDGLGEWVADQAKTLRAEIAASEKYLLEPVEPAPPMVQKEASVLQTELQALQADLTRMSMWKAQADVELTAPVLVSAHERLQELSALQATQGTRQALIAQQATIRQALDGFPALGEAPVAHLDADKRAELVAETAAFTESTTQKAQIETMLGKMPEPKLTAAQVADIEARTALRDRWDAKRALMAKLAEYVCPKCDHHWHDEDPRLKDYADVPEAQPVIANIEIKDAHAARPLLAQAETRQGLVDALALLQERLLGKHDWTQTIKAIDAAAQAQALYQERLQQEGRRVDLVAQLDAIVLPEDQSVLIAELVSNQKALEDYKRDLKTYAEKLEAKRHATEQYEAFPANLVEQVGELQAQWQARGIYESEVAAYMTARTKYETLLAEVNVSRETLKQWVLCSQAITTLRQRVKGYLLPSLNKVASGLLQMMTAGVMGWIVVSEDFDITVDGQRLETLSGAGKSVANLALRIGLGQVLTNRTFSVLLLDEIDASCDEERSAAIAECLQRLTGQIQQVVQVSHKSGLTADNYIRL